MFYIHVGAGGVVLPPAYEELAPPSNYDIACKVQATPVEATAPVENKIIDQNH